MEPQASQQKAKIRAGSNGANELQIPPTQQIGADMPATETTRHRDHTAKVKTNAGPPLLDRDSYDSTALQEILDKSVHAMASRFTGGFSPSALAGAIAYPIFNKRELIEINEPTAVECKQASTSRKELDRWTV